MNQSNTSTRSIDKLAPLYGLVLSGGKSTRMKREKAMLNYHGKTQLAYLFELLSAHCEQVFVSIQKPRTNVYANFPQIHDMYENLGPFSGILSAMTVFPDVAWLVLANDMPYVDAETVRTLIQHRHPQTAAIAYQNPQTAFPEPLCTIYEPIMRTRLLTFLDSGGRCCGKVLKDSDVQRLQPSNNFTLTNVNSPEEYQHVTRSSRIAQNTSKSRICIFE